MKLREFQRMASQVAKAIGAESATLDRNSADFNGEWTLRQLKEALHPLGFEFNKTEYVFVAAGLVGYLHGSRAHPTANKFTHFSFELNRV